MMNIWYYILGYWLLGAVVNLVITLLSGFEKRDWKSFLFFWIVLPFFFPLTLIALKDEIAEGFKKRTKRSKKDKKTMKKQPSVHSKEQAPTKNQDEDPFEKEWQAFIKDISPCEDPHIIEKKVVADDLIVSTNCEKMVIYLEDSRNEVVNDFITKNYNVICRIFGQWGYTFIYAPKEMEGLARHYATEVPDVEWNAATILDMLQCHYDEPIGSALVMINDVEWDDDQDCWMAAMKGLQLDGENETELTAQIRGYWGILNEEYKTHKAEESRYRYRLAEEDRKRKECSAKRGFSRSILSRMANDFLEEELTEEDEQLLEEIQARVTKLHQRGIKQHLIEQFIKMTVPTSHLEVTADARILLTDYDKEVQMLPIDKVVYIFYLRHPEGVSIKCLADHKEELMALYARVLGKEKLTDKQKASVELLCNPLDNSINEKLSRIRKSFCAVVHESVASHYVVQGMRGEERYIKIDEELIVADEWMKS